MWFGVLFVVAAYLYLTPWFFYWYIVAPVALVAALPRNRLTDPSLVFAGSSLITLRFHPVLVNWTVQTLARYGLPVAVFRSQGRNERRSSDADASVAPLLAPHSGSGISPITVPSTSALPVRAPAAD
jgi:hypothetical protein